MLTPKNNLFPIRNDILARVAKSFFNNHFAEIDSVPSEVFPDGSQCYHQNIANDRNIVRQICMAILGFCPEDEEGKNISLSEYAQKALKREKLEPSKISVISSACMACRKERYIVSDLCRSCIARPCQVNCPKKAISFVNGKAFIDQDACIKCGRCHDVCPYSAIIKNVIPCEDSCPVGAISKDAQGKEHIDTAKCISCGKCLKSCPFGAIVERSQMVDVLKTMLDTDKKVIAMVAPAIVGQFGGTVNNLVGALKALGFDDVIEVAVGADITTQKEAAEFVERMEEGKNFMTTSCCPAYFRAAQIHIPEIKDFVSSTKTPMYYTAELVKQEHPNCAAVFVGPCFAKRVEAETDPNVDYVLTFEELNAMFIGAGIDVATAPAAEFSKLSCAQGRGFPLTGGVAGAVASLVEGKTEIRPEKIDGLSAENIKLLKRYATKGCENNMLEVMCCPGGCIAGPGCIAMANKATIQIKNYTVQGEDLKNK